MAMARIATTAVACAALGTACTLDFGRFEESGYDASVDGSDASQQDGASDAIFGGSSSGSSGAGSGSGSGGSGSSGSTSSGGDACVPESDMQVCQFQLFQCGKQTLMDNCGVTRSVDCGACNAGSECSKGECVDCCNICSANKTCVSGDGVKYAACNGGPCTPNQATCSSTKGCSCCSPQ
jgi:hypothetical protein